MTPAPWSKAGGLLQMIELNDQKHDDAHKRLRTDLRELETQVNAGFQSLREGYSANVNKIEALAAKPLDATKLVLAPRVVVSIVACSIGLAGAVWASTAGLRSDMRDILTRMEAQKQASEAAGRLQEVQTSAIKTSVDEMKRRQELQQYEIQNLKEVILTGKSLGPK